jgi:hypothetical protein
MLEMKKITYLRDGKWRENAHIYIASKEHINSADVLQKGWYVVKVTNKTIDGIIVLQHRTMNRYSTFNIKRDLDAQSRTMELNKCYLVHIMPAEDKKISWAYEIK